MSGIEWTRAYLALGGNLGDVMRAMATALVAMDDADQCRVLTVSPVYRTPPWGIEDQPDFYNACASIMTCEAPDSLLRFVKDLEDKAGRTASVRNGPRVLDLDILTYGERVIEMPGLTIPHPRMAERAFVLVPLADIAPDLVVAGQTVATLAARADASGMTRLDVRLWPGVAGG